MSVSRRLRFEILRRDGHTCRYCGAQAPDVVLTIDHVTPTALGGGDEPANLVTACAACNGGKTSIAPGSPLVDDVERDALKWARAIETAAEWRAMERRQIDEAVAQVDRKWRAWHVKATGEEVPRDDDWRAGTERFLGLGLTPVEMIRLVDVAMNAPNLRLENTWRYFCGCCWRAISDLQETARQIIEAGDEMAKDGW